MTAAHNDDNGASIQAEIQSRIDDHEATRKAVIAAACGLVVVCTVGAAVVAMVVR